MRNSETDLRFPIGNFEKPKDISDVNLSNFILSIEELPKNLRDSVDGLNDEQLDTPYRVDGWNLRQVVHHVGDSHINAYSRFRIALTEENPTIRPYREELWAELADKNMPVEVSLNLIEAVHARWTFLLRSMSADDFQRPLNHPESGTWKLDEMLALYDWHSRHHTAHIKNLKKIKNW